jgi:hypothetical protein
MSQHTDGSTRSAYPGFRSDQWVGVRELADILGIHRLTASSYLRTGILPGVKMGSARNALWRVPIEAADAFLAGDHTELARIAAALAQAQHRPHAHCTDSPVASSATAA